MKYVRIIGAGLVLAMPAIAFAAATPHTFKELAHLLVNLINIAIPMLITAGIVIYMYGVSTNILNLGEDSKEKMKAYFFWGIIILFLMVSFWGILRLLQDTLNFPVGY